MDDQPLAQMVRTSENRLLEEYISFKNEYNKILKELNSRKSKELEITITAINQIISQLNEIIEELKKENTNILIYINLYKKLKILIDSIPKVDFWKRQRGPMLPNELEDVHETFINLANMLIAEHNK